MMRWLSQLWLSALADRGRPPSALWRMTFGRIKSHRDFAARLTGGAAIAGNLVCIDLDGFWRFHVFLRHWVVAAVQGDPLLIDPTDWRMIPKAAQQSMSFRAG